jgi:hypothetical protein
MVESQNIDAGIVAKSPGNQKEFPPPSVSRDIGRSFGYDDRELALAKVAEVHKVGQRQGLASCMARLAGIRQTDGHGDARR